jgi:hypothetical protein
LHRPRRSAIIVSLRPPALILIDAPFSSRLSRHTATSELIESRGIDEPASSGLRFEDRGIHALKGLQDNVRRRPRLYATCEQGPGAIRDFLWPA